MSHRVHLGRPSAASRIVWKKLKNEVDLTGVMTRSELRRTPMASASTSLNSAF